MKGLILCAGKGTRLRPYTNFLPKTLLPVAGKPVLSYCLDHLLQQGIKDIGVVINPTQQVIRDYLGDGKEYGVHIHYIIQKEPKGIAHAVRSAQGFIGKDPFILLLGDNLIVEGLESLIIPFEKSQSQASLMLAKVENPSDYGIAEIEGNEIINLEEKPKVPKNNLAIIGAYLFDSTIFEAICHIAPSARGEYEITDAIQWLIEHGKTISYTLTDKFYSDVGTVDRWLSANEWTLQQWWAGQIMIGNNTIIENCTLHPPLLIGESCILRNAVIGPYVSMQKECQVLNSRVDRSILLENSKLVDLPQVTCRAIGGEIK